MSQLQKPALKGLAQRINGLWKILSRKIKDDVKENPSLYSIIYVPNGFIIPGGTHVNNCLINLIFNLWLPNLIKHSQKLQLVTSAVLHFALLLSIMKVLLSFEGDLWLD